jgi:hypothetical protein
MDLTRARDEIEGPVSIGPFSNSALRLHAGGARSMWMAHCYLASLDQGARRRRAGVVSYGHDMETARAALVAQLHVICEAGDPTVDDLRSALRELGQSTSGRKAVLCARLIAAWEVCQPPEAGT